jgi:hypothetical protein
MAMNHRQFTWWRRFYTTRHLKQLPWKGYSELLQRIDYGEYEFNHLGFEVYLEDKVYLAEIEKLKQTLKSKSQDVIEEAIIHLRKKFHKRKEFIMERHLIEEQKSLNRLAQDLASEFGMEKEQVEEVMETFDGTTRHIYYHLQSINNNRVPPTAEEVEMIPKTVEPQPRHVLRYDEMKWQPLWQEVITEKKVWGAL